MNCFSIHIVALLVIVIVSYATGGPSKEVIEKFEEVKMH